MRYKDNFPNIGEIVVCLVESIQKNTVQVRLEDFGGLKHEERAHGMVHISELSNRWVKNINNIVSVGQRVVLSVLRVNEERGYVDLSLRRVNDSQRKVTMSAWKHNKKIEGLLEFYANQHEMTLDDLYDKALFTIINTYGDFRRGFEIIKEEGFEELEKLKDEIDLSEQELKDLYELIQENVKIPKITITGEFEIISYEGNGIEIIKNALKELENVKKPKGLKMHLSYIGAPIYRVEIEAKDYPTAEKFLSEIEKNLNKFVTGKSYIELNRDTLSNAQD